MKMLIPKILAALLLVTSAASAQTSLYLKLPGITGESPDPGHTGDIGVQTASFSVNQTTLGVAGATGAGAGKSQFTTLEIQKRLDSSSPVIFLNCALGKSLPSAKLIFQKGSGPLDYFVIELTNVFIAGYETTADGDGVQETVRLSFSTVKITYTPQITGGGVGTPITASFDVAKNKIFTSAVAQ